MKCFLISKNYYDRFCNIDFVRLFTDIESVGFKVLNNYGISSYDMFSLLALNNIIIENNYLYLKFLECYHYDPTKILSLIEWLDFEAESSDTTELCEFRPYSSDFLLVIVNYNFFKELKDGTLGSKFTDCGLDYIYSNFGEEAVLNSPFFELKFNTTRGIYYGY